MTLGLMNWQSDADLVRDENEQAIEQEKLQRKITVESSLAGHIRQSWESNKQAKRDVEQRLLECLRRHKGEYDDQKLSAIRQTGGSEVYIKLTTTKTRAAESWIRDVIMPVDERPWGLTPTPIAEVPEPIRQALMQNVQAQIQEMQAQGEQVDQGTVQKMMEEAVENAKKRAQELAEKASDKMELKIEDQLAEGGWTDALESFTSDFAIYLTAFIKGPVLRRRKTLAWKEGWKPVQIDEVRPEFERVSPFDMYPSADAVDIDTSANLIERARYTRATLNGLIGVEGYDDDALRQVLTEYGQGGLRDWIWGDQERARLEGREHEWLLGDNTIDALLYWGGVQGLTLLQWGMNPDQVPDPLMEYQVEAILIGQHCIRCIMHSDPMHRRPYHKASFQEISGSFWGMAIPELMDDIQDICNATARSLVNNLAISSGPQVDVSMDRLAPGEDPEDIYPWKVWQTNSDRMGTGNNPAIRFFQPASNAAELMSVFEKFETKADDATNIPRYIYGNENIGGAGSTASGLSMLMESANKGIKAAIGHIDTGVIRRVIEALWLHNMMYSNDNSVKGDSKVIPKGSNAMLQRERTAMQQRELFDKIANPDIIGQALGVRGQIELLRAVTKGVGITGLVPDGIEDQIEENMNQKDPQSELMLAELEAKIAKLQAEAKRTQAQAEKDIAEAGHEPVKAEKTLAEIQEILNQMRQQNAGQTNETRRATNGGSGQAGNQRQPRMESPGAMAGVREAAFPGLPIGRSAAGGNTPSPRGAGYNQQAGR